ncbi:hypothetical protein LCGC14_0688070 [marine sediment metagenome]|uniref:Radical SAM core domain-containing protein n=1 Tax=marine sediment metagenome TaxID=412755 RepID=A0A0F9QR35_9ZZZZ
MRVLLVKIDGKMPNLALMKLSAWHKALGDQVGLHIQSPDRVYISVIFKQNYPQAQGVVNFYPLADCFLGGPGLDEPNTLGAILGHLEIDDVMPDYGLFGCDFSMGFSMRGCFRNCPWCIVPRLEGAVRVGTPIEKFHHPDHKKIVLLDNNFFAGPNWRPTLKYIQDQGLKVNFNQGLDIRLMNEEMAGLLADTKCYSWSFGTAMLYFAWDRMDIEAQVRKGIEMLLEAGIHHRRLTVYVLTGFNTTHTEDLYRVMALKEYDIEPYIMVYNDRKDDQFLHHLERWVNGRLHRSVPDFGTYRYLSPSQRVEAKKILSGFKPRRLENESR